MTGLFLVSGGTLLVVVLLVSGVGKIIGPASFAASLREMRLLPGGAVPLAAALVVAGELLAALSVLLGLTAMPELLGYGFALCAALFLLFDVVVISVIRRGRSVACTCFGRTASAFSARHVVRNTLLTATAVAGLVAAGAGTASWTTATGIAVVMGLVLSLLVILMDDLADLL